MKIVLWNIRSGGREKADDIEAALRAQNPDVVVLNEYHAGTSDPLVERLQRHGLKHVALSSPPARYGGVAICSKPALSMRPTPEGLGPMAHRCLVADVGGGAGIVLWAVYAPYEGPDVATFWNGVLSSLAADRERDAILVGDLNAGIHGEDFPAAAGQLAGAPFIRELSAMGFHDLWRREHGPMAQDHSWHGGTHPYRIDHAFASPGAAARARICRYRHEEREAGTSDHSMLLVELTPRPLARVGSQRWLQVAVNHHQSMLDKPILRALGAPESATVEWLSPVEDEGYVEYRDGATLDRLGLQLPTDALREFWPAGGPVWDGLARVSTGDVLLLEAKAHIAEILSMGTRATGESRDRILQTIRELQVDLTRFEVADWSGRFYQYANRIAHLDFLRRHGVPAHLVYVYFTDAPDVAMPASREQWEGAIRLMDGYLGLGRHRLSRYVHKVFVDASALSSEGVSATDASFLTASAAMSSHGPNAGA